VNKFLRSSRNSRGHRIWRTESQYCAENRWRGGVFSSLPEGPSASRGCNREWWQSPYYRVALGAFLSSGNGRHFAHAWAVRTELGALDSKKIRESPMFMRIAAILTSQRYVHEWIASF
jgi:hypothetical protein